MATTRKRTTKPTAKRTSRKADDSLAARTGRTIRERPYVSAAIATGAVTAVAAAAAGAFFFSRRDSSATSGDDSDSFTTRVKDGVAEATAKAKEMAGRWMGSDDKQQSEFAEEALSLKSTGKQAKHPADPVVEQQAKAGAIA